MGIGPALKQLFLDLHQLNDRSEYEEALHRELSMLQKAFGAFDQNVGGVRLSDVAYMSCKAWIEKVSQPGERLGEFEVGTEGARIRLDPLDIYQIETEVDLGPKDIKRLRCSYDRCPNKRI